MGNESSGYNRLKEIAVASLKAKDIYNAENIWYSSKELNELCSDAKVSKLMNKGSQFEIITGTKTFSDNPNVGFEKSLSEFNVREPIGKTETVNIPDVTSVINYQCRVNGRLIDMSGEYVK